MRFHPAIKMLSIAVSPYITGNEIPVTSSIMNIVHATGQICRPAEKMAGKKTTQGRSKCVRSLQTRDMHLHFIRSNIGVNGNRYNFSSKVKTC